MDIKKYLYWLVAIAEIIAVAFEIDVLRQISKPLLMITLLIYFWDRSDNRKDEKWVKHVTLALAFSWIGDVMLLFTHKSFMLFFAGLSAFLFAHIIYIIAYTRATYKNSLAIQFSITPILLLGFFVMISWLILPYLASVVQVPVAIYGFVLLLMASAAWYRRGTTNTMSFQMVFGGALLFMVSDSLLAINRFSQTIPYANLLVMITYIMAQWLIVNGLLKHKPNNN